MIGLVVWENNVDSIGPSLLRTAHHLNLSHGAIYATGLIKDKAPPNIVTSC
jgi:hypothetical protein